MSAGPLPGFALVAFDPASMLMTDVIPCEDGHLRAVRRHPSPQRTRFKNKPHVSTKKLLDQAEKTDESQEKPSR